MARHGEPVEPRHAQGNEDACGSDNRPVMVSLSNHDVRGEMKML
ncbi:MAG: hypothetical protein JWQ54_4124 [Mucilaginibacter sp.]|nr:hypothetical protein [Mucilaginibacter sp.]